MFRDGYTVIGISGHQLCLIKIRIEFTGMHVSDRERPIVPDLIGNQNGLIEMAEPLCKLALPLTSDGSQIQKVLCMLDGRVFR